MAGKKEYTKEEKIKKEKTRLKGITYVSAAASLQK